MRRLRPRRRTARITHRCPSPKSNTMITTDTTIAHLLDQLIAEGTKAWTQVVTTPKNAVMRLEREQCRG